MLRNLRSSSGKRTWIKFLDDEKWVIISPAHYDSKNSPTKRQPRQAFFHSKKKKRNLNNNAIIWPEPPHINQKRRQNVPLRLCRRIYRLWRKRHCCNSCQCSCCRVIVLKKLSFINLLFPGHSFQPSSMQFMTNYSHLTSQKHISWKEVKVSKEKWQNPSMK